MRDELQKKVDRAVRFLRSIPDEEPVEVAYSGGKDSDVILELVKMSGIKCHPLYYDEDGVFHPEMRLGCMCCPLASRKNRIGEFRKYPNMVKAYIRAENKYL